MNEEDELLCEFDVQLSHDLSENLFLFQYPLRTSERPIQYSDISECRIKPQHKQIELDFSSTNSTIKTVPIPDLSNNVLGFIKDGVVHLTPLKNGVVLKPSFEYIDVLEEAKKEEEQTDSKEEKKEEDPNQPQEIQVQFKRRESEKVVEARENTFSFQNQRLHAEKWTNLKLKDESEVISHPHPDSAVLSALSSSQKAPVVFDVSAEQYLGTLTTQDSSIPSSAPVPGGAKPGFRSVLSREILSAMSLDERVNAILSNAHVLHFFRIVDIVTKGQPHISQQEVLECLERHAVLVQGCWAVKSSLCCQDENLVAARDYLLLRLDQGYTVNAREFSTTVGLSVDVARAILREIALLTPGIGWKLKKARDDLFINSHPQVVARAKATWAARENELAERFGISIHEAERESLLLSSPFPYYSETSSITIEDQLHHFLVNLLFTEGVCTLQYINSRLALQKLDKDPANLLAQGVADRQVLQALAQCARLVRNGYVLRHVENNEINKFRDVILTLFEAAPRLRKTEVRTATLSQLRLDIPTRVYTKIMNEVAVMVGEQWVWKACAEA